MDGSRLDRLARLVAARSRRQVLRVLAGAMGAALLGQPAGVRAGCNPACGANAHCGPGGCECDVGYAGDGFTCTDVDECTLDTDNCDPDATCTNSPGSFTCACNPGFVGDGVTCCPTGQTACGGACVNLRTSRKHCGRCGKRCRRGKVCRRSWCVGD